MNAGTEGEASPAPSGNGSRDDPLIFESQSKGPNLQEFMSEWDPLNDNIRRGYIVNHVFKKILEKPGDHPGFEIQDDFIWMKNRGGEEVLCVPSTNSMGMTLHGRIIEQAHMIIGHFGPLKMSEYIRHWYWWPRLQYEVETFCNSCE